MTDPSHRDPTPSLFARSLSSLWQWLRSRRPGRNRSATRALGDRGEKAAANLLKSKGYRILGRQVRVPMGEADLVAEAPEDRAIVIVEVKSRMVQMDDGARNIAPERSITAHKQRKLITIARHLTRANGWDGRPVRIDVIAVEFENGKVTNVRHHIGAVVASRG